MKRRNWFLLFILVAAAGFVIYTHKTAPYQKTEGRIFGTFYNITYQSTENLDKAILAALHQVDTSLSMFNKESTVSKINRNENPELDKLFLYIFPRAVKVSEATNGAFDITVAPLVNAWGFGIKKQNAQAVNPTTEQINRIREYVGYNKLHINDRKLTKDDPRTMIDLSAIAKGLGSDVVADVLNKAKVENYMVEIGGEVVAKGKNEKGKPWRIGVTKPQAEEGQEAGFQCILQLNNCAAATSGNYRNFHIVDGVKYAHTIDPRTGFPVQHDIISATVIAPKCYEADAYATAFMVMGLEQAKKVLSKQKHLNAYIIYNGKDDTRKVWMTEGFEKYIAQ